MVEVTKVVAGMAVGDVVVVTGTEVGSVSPVFPIVVVVMTEVEEAGFAAIDVVVAVVGTAVEE